MISRGTDYSIDLPLRATAPHGARVGHGLHGTREERGLYTHVHGPHFFLPSVSHIYYISYHIRQGSRVTAHTRAHPSTWNKPHAAQRVRADSGPMPTPMNSNNQTEYLLASPVLTRFPHGIQHRYAALRFRPNPSTQSLGTIRRAAGDGSTT